MNWRPLMFRRIFGKKPKPLPTLEIKEFSLDSLEGEIKKLKEGRLEVVKGEIGPLVEGIVGACEDIRASVKIQGAKPIEELIPGKEAKA
jgi:hypothetical protein